jgi:hypothetical protein
MILPEIDRYRERNEETAVDRIESALSAARRLIKFGMPVFPARVDDNGDPDVNNDSRWGRWQKYPADLDILRGYKRGDGLGAICGIVFDVIDIDPRNGGKFSFRRMSDELGDDGPVVYGKVRTPSGGLHLYIAALGIGSHNNILPGIDLKGGFPDGSSRGFVFLPPTIRPVKGADSGIISPDDDESIRMGTYRWSEDIQRPDGDASNDELISYLSAAIDSNKKTRKANSEARDSTDSLRKECIEASAGMQRSALLRYVHELERRGYAKGDMIVLLQTLCSQMPVYDKRRPWYPARGNPNRELLTLFHAPGEVIPDATPAELEGLSVSEGPSVARVLPSGLVAFSEISRDLTTWLWTRYLALGSVTIFDGDAGIGKSLVTLDIAARITSGADMPDGSRCAEPGSILLLAPEDSDSVTAGRLDAAGADTSMIYRPSLNLRKKRGQDPKAYAGNEMLSFPSGTAKVKTWIKSYGVRLVIVDPITAFLDEDVNSNNDASVRRALSRFSSALAEVGASALFIRHYNKNSQLAANQRGGGSVAFGAVSRVQLIGGTVPAEDMGQVENPPPKLFAITQVKNNHLQRIHDEALAYAIEDSEIVADMDGNMVPRIRWYGKVMVSADTLASGPAKKKPGPSPVVQDEIIEMLSEMFSNMPVIDSAEAMAQLRSSGITANKETITKARKAMGVIAKARRVKGKPGVQGWDWTLNTRTEIGDLDD